MSSKTRLGTTFVPARAWRRSAGATGARHFRASRSRRTAREEDLFGADLAAERLGAGPSRRRRRGDGCGPQRARRDRHVLAARDGADQRRSDVGCRCGSGHQSAERLRLEARVHSGQQRQVLALARRRRGRRFDRRARYWCLPARAASLPVDRFLHRQECRRWPRTAHAVCRSQGRVSRRFAVLRRGRAAARRRQQPVDRLPAHDRVGRRDAGRSQSVQESRGPAFVGERPGTRRADRLLGAHRPQYGRPAAARPAPNQRARHGNEHDQRARADARRRRDAGDQRRAHHRTPTSRKQR